MEYSLVGKTSHDQNADEPGRSALMPVCLEEAKTNGDGKPVHEACYVYRLREAEQQRRETALRNREMGKVRSVQF
jgi:hypothetical protein